MQVNGHTLKCSHCQGSSFEHKRIMLNTPGLTFFNMDWLNKSADTFICHGCGRIEWFADANVSEDSNGGGDRDCARCGFSMASVAVCPNCGAPA